MVKPRDDLQVVACRVDMAIRDGRTQALPIYQSFDLATGLGRWPSSLLHLTSVRLRLPPLYVDTREKHEAKHEKSWDNRTTIKPCVLNARFVKVTERSPDYDQLLTASRDERRVFQVIETRYGLKRRIYEVVDDLSHGLRQGIHVRNQYELERQRLLVARLEFLDRQRIQKSDVSSLTVQESELADLALAKIEMRLSEIERILEDRIIREERLRSYAQKSNLHLFFLTQSLANLRGNLIRSSFMDRGAVADYLTGLVADLSMFTSGEIRPYRNFARHILERIIEQNQQIQLPEAVRLLGKAVGHLTQAALILSHWSESIPEDERLVANLRWVSIPDKPISL